MMGDVTRLGKTGQFPALGRGDFSLLMKVPVAVDLFTTDFWKIVCEEDPATAGHLNACLMPGCDFFTYEDVMPENHVALVRSGNNLFWYIDGAVDNVDNGLDWLDLPGGAYEHRVDDCVLFEYGLTPQEIRRIYRGMPL